MLIGVTLNYYLKNTKLSKNNLAALLYLPWTYRELTMVCIEITLLDLCAYTIYHRLVFLLFIPIRTTKI